MAGGSFAALSSSLKDRFTTSNGKCDDVKDQICSALDPKKVNPIRTAFMWQPDTLLCKRLGVAVPRVANVGFGLPSRSTETKEQKFFRQEILQKAGELPQRQMQDSRECKPSEEKSDIDRPTMDILKSIFEPVSDDDMSISEGEIDSTQVEPFPMSTSKNDDVVTISIDGDGNQSPDHLIGKHAESGDKKRGPQDEYQYKGLRRTSSSLEQNALDRRQKRSRRNSNNRIEKRILNHKKDRKYEKRKKRKR
jgi:hypothetical protein